MAKGMRHVSEICDDIVRKIGKKQCSRCDEWKRVTEFYRNAQSKDGYRPECKECGKSPVPERDPVETFWSKVDKEGDCWEWQASRHTNNGYGRFWTDGRHVVAHRFIYEQERGEIPDSYEVCHRCDNPRCVNPAHLFLATHAENIRDSARKGRQIIKLTIDEARQIKRLLKRSDLTQKAIAERFGVSVGAVNHIKRGTTWGWLNEG